MLNDSPREATAEDRLRQAVEAAGGLCPKLTPPPAGIPDRMVIYGGQIYLVEMKRRRGGALRPDQRRWHAAAARAGVQVEILYGREDVDAFLTRLGIPTTQRARAREVRDLTD